MADPIQPDADLRSRVVFLEHKYNDIKGRIANHEKWQAEQNIANAVRDERWTSTLARLNSIDGNLKWIVRLVIGGIITALLAFIVGGGLGIPK